MTYYQYEDTHSAAQTINQSIILIHEIVWEILDKVAGPWNIGYTHIYLRWDYSFCQPKQ